MKVLFVRGLVKGLWRVASWLPGRLTSLAWKFLPGPFKYLAVIVAVVTYGVTPIVYYKIPDAATRLFLSDDPTIIVHEGNPAAKANITVYGGAGSSPSVQVSELLPTLEQYAKKVRVVENPKYLFDGEETVETVDAAIDIDQERAKAENRPEEEIFIGISMGGPLSYDTIAKGIAEGDDPTKYSAVMYGSPYDEDDVIGVEDWLKTADDLFLLDLTGLITSEVTGPITGLPGFEPGDPSKMSSDINREELAKSNESYKNWKASSWADQGGYVFGHDPMSRLPGVRWVYISAEDDKFIDSPGAYRKYQASQEGAVHPLSVVGGHAALHDWPREYAQVTGRALDYALGV